MSIVAENLTGIRNRIDQVCLRSSRDSSCIELIAVSKTFPADSIRQALEAGQHVFGESKLQEALPKIELLPSSLQWHFIGNVQRNKVRKILPAFDVVHAVDSLRLATYVNEVAEELGLFPKIFLQVNLGGEVSKGGFESDVMRASFESLLSLHRLEIMGLMGIPPAGPDAESSRPWFAGLRKLRDRLQSEFSVPMPSLSMGMSDDFEVAIEEGATHVRVGSSIFGKRAYRVDGELG